MIRPIWALAVVTLLAPALAHAGDIRITHRPEKVVNGGLFWMEIEGAGEKPVQVRFNGVDIPTSREQEKVTALVPVHYETPPATMKVRVTVGQGDQAQRHFHPVEIIDAGYKIEKLTLPKDKVSGFDAETLARIKREKKKLDAIWVAKTPDRLWNGAWAWPVDGPVTSPFGGRRIINGLKKSPHSGTDHRAATGTPIHAAHDGRVALVDDQFYTGNLVLIDHGQTLYTMYFHMSKVEVEEGQVVKQGDVIGLVGATGRASGPHLHWGIRYLNHRLDAERLLELFPPDKVADGGITERSDEQ